MIKTAIIGLGKMGMSHCALLGAHPEVDLIAICDPDGLLQSAFKKLTGFQVYDDYKKMIETEKPEAVFVATPTRFHSEMVLYALERGIHVFCEKPFSLTSEEGEKMVAVAKAKGCVNQVGYHNRFIGTFNEMKRLFAAGVIGTPFHFMGEAYGPVVLKPKGGTWRADKKSGGGCLMDYASHVLNLINYITGSHLTEARGTFMPRIFSKEVDDAIYATLKVESGLQGQLSVCWSDDTHRKMTTSLKIEGDKGKLEADATVLKIYLKEDNEKEALKKGWNTKYITELTPQVYFNLRGEEYSAQIDHFVRCIQNETMNHRNTFEEALQTDYIVDKLIEDAK